LGSIAEKVFTSVQRFYSPLSASSYLDFLIAHSKMENCKFQCFGYSRSPIPRIDCSYNYLYEQTTIHFYALECETVKMITFKYELE
jgi:hypothetical protein